MGASSLLEKRISFAAFDLLKEAVARKWIVAVGVLITLMLLTLAFFLRLDVVDGALAASKFFGRDMGSDIRAVDVELKPLFQAAGGLLFYSCLILGAFITADFAPVLLSPGRIEHTLSLPVKRWELLTGMFCGVLVLVLLGCIYAAGGFTIILGIKTGYWTCAPVVTGLLAVAAFCAVYGPMLAVAVFFRSGAVSGAVGGLIISFGVMASYRAEMAGMFQPGTGRWIFEILIAPFPRIVKLSTFAMNLDYSAYTDWLEFLRLIAGHILFGSAALVVGILGFDKKDF